MFKQFSIRDFYDHKKFLITSLMEDVQPTKGRPCTGSMMSFRSGRLIAALFTEESLGDPCVQTGEVFVRHDEPLITLLRLNGTRSVDKRKVSF